MPVVLRTEKGWLCKENRHSLLLYSLDLEPGCSRKAPPPSRPFAEHKDKRGAVLEMALLQGKHGAFCRK